MAERKPSTVAAYLRSRGSSEATAWKGGRGRQGPLGAWLVREKAAIVAGRGAVPALTWREVADLAAADGVRRPDGSPYAERQVSQAWSSLVARKLVPRGAADGVARQTEPAPVQGQQQGQGRVPAPWGRAGTEGASGAQPPAPMPPSPAVSPGPAQGSGEAASREPKLTANSLLPVKRFGGKRS